MSGQVQITLRPPPNVEFVHGYPGIPPGGPDRVQAAVRGAVEVRVTTVGVKAKWVRIELRKVETLPGAGAGNTFYDFVGPSPVNLWTASEEYGILRTQDFPFSIRIPESIPPSITLEHRAGIHYELVASVCTLEKKGFLRRKKSRVQTQLANITIDKHELHSAWPVYCQPETRKHTHEGLTLTAERNNTCYGPGDPISVTITLRSDKLSAIICRGFELTLNETTIFRGHLTGKKGAAPIVRTVQVCEYKHLVNANMFGGTQQRAELVCQLSPEHTTTTLNAARHIDITYMLTAKAIISPGDPLSIDLPVIITNWQRNVSLEAIRRIGPAPTLSLLPINMLPNQQTMKIEPAPRAATLPTHRSTTSNSTTTPSSTLPSGRPEEFGYGAGLGYNVRPTHRTNTSSASNTGMEEFGTRPSAAAGGSASTTARRPNSSRFTITNMPADPLSPQSQTQSRSGASKGLWPTAEEEKEQLYESARAKVEKVQGNVARPNSPPPPQAQASTPAKSASPPRTTPWLTAEQEKLRLFNEAQAAVKKTQGLESYSPSSSLHERSNSDLRKSPDLSRAPSASASVSLSNPAPAPNQNKVVTPADLYAQAISARNESLSKQQSLPAPKLSARVAVPQYLTADQEKAALRRYEEAKMAVNRVQGVGYSAEPEEYEDGAGASGSGAIAMDLQPDDTNELPPSFEMSTSGNSNVIPASHVGEKERLRKEYERQDGLKRQDTLPPSFLESQSQSSRGAHGPPSPPVQTPPTPNSGTSSQTRSPSSARRPTPAPPSASSSSKVLTAAEEKAMLKARYAAEAKGVRSVSPPYLNGNGHANHVNHVSLTPPPETNYFQSNFHSSPPSHSNSYSPTPEPQPQPLASSSPPPLMPRPPAEYIQETQAEDARVSRFALDGVIPADEEIIRSTSPTFKHGAVTAPVYLPTPTSASPPLNVRPFSPFSAAFEETTGLVVPPPPPLVSSKYAEE